MRVGAQLGLERRALAELAAVALLHDVGKVGIPDAILHKPGPLDDDERAVMREHPIIGERILSAVPGLESVARAVRHEHEHWDGDGYPDGLSGEEIPLASRIVLACDAWHALVSDRPYRNALEQDDALAELRRCSGSQFDPAVIDALLATIESPRGVTVVSSDPGSLLAASGADSLDSELVALIAVASAASGAHRIDDVLEVVAEASCNAIGAASLSIERWLPEHRLVRTLDQRRRSRSRRGAPPGRRDLQDRGRHGAVRRDRARRHPLRLARRSRPAADRARPAGLARQALLPGRADHVRRNRVGSDLGLAAPRPAQVLRAGCALPARHQRADQRRDRACRGLHADRRPGGHGRAHGSRQPARVRRAAGARARRGAPRRRRPRARAARRRQPQGHQRPPRPRGGRRSDPGASASR